MKGTARGQRRRESGERVAEHREQLCTPSDDLSVAAEHRLGDAMEVWPSAELACSATRREAARLEQIKSGQTDSTCLRTRRLDRQSFQLLHERIIRRAKLRAVLLEVSERGGDQGRVHRHALKER